MTRQLLDIAERTVATYLQALLGLIVAGGLDLTNLSTLKAAAIAAIPAAFAVLKGAVGALLGDPRTASWLPRTGS